MIRFTDIQLRRGSKLLFDEASFVVHPGQRLGVTGANGCGKTSLLAMIMDELHPDQGEFDIPSDWLTAHVEQEMPTTAKPALEYVLDGDVRLREYQSLLAKAEADDDGLASAEIHVLLDNIEAWSAEARAGQIMHGLGFLPGSEWRPVREFSGGWRVRLNLAQALICRSDLLLLDEPTNHLDLDAVIWLERWLKSYPGVLMLISHDREFLDGTCTHILNISHKKLDVFAGNYSLFERKKAEQMQLQQSAFKKQQRERAHMQSFVDRFRAKATKARQAQSRLKALERMETIAPVLMNSPFHFRFPNPKSMPDPIVNTRHLVAGYGETVVLSGVELVIHPGDRIGLLGRNGEGKSTLVKTVSNILPRIAGDFVPGKGLKIGYFAQDQLELLDPDKTAIENARDLKTGNSEQELRNLLGGFGFSGDQAMTPVEVFSGGEKARLVLALIAAIKPNFLLLDEPTNHLDMEVRQVLSMALQAYEGAVILVSHDRHLLRTICDRFYVVANGAVEPFDGDLEDYANWLRDDKQDKAANKKSKSGSKKELRQQKAEAREQRQALSKRVKKCEKEMEQLAAQKTALDEKLADPELYENAGTEEMHKLGRKLAGIKKALDKAEQDWLAACEELEAQS